MVSSELQKTTAYNYFTGWVLLSGASLYPLFMLLLASVLICLWHRRLLEVYWLHFQLVNTDSLLFIVHIWDFQLNWIETHNKLSYWCGDLFETFNPLLNNLLHIDVLILYPFLPPSVLVLFVVFSFIVLLCHFYESSINSTDSRIDILEEQ